MWRAVINEQPSAWTDDPAAHAEIIRVWAWGEMIPEWQYLDLLSLKARMLADGRAHPCLTPMIPINPMTLPVIRAADIARRPRPIGTTKDPNR